MYELNKKCVLMIPLRSGHTPGITSGFFFWNAGLELQKTPVGLIRSILYESLQDMIYGPLEQNKGIIQWLFVDRWSQFTSFGGGLHDFTFTELRRGYELMISDVSKKFLFLVDGLDEMDEYSNELMDMILASAKKDNVKYCVSSRASPVFQSAFETRPRMVMDEYTKVDILSYVTSAFNLDARLQALRGKLDEETERHIVGALADKASGVFLLAVIATDFVLSSIREGDDFLILKDRVDALPYQFDDFLAHVLHQISPADLQALWQLHTLIEIHPYPHLLPLSFALTAETSATLAADVRPLKPGESAKRIEDMRSLLTFRCKTFFSIFNIASPEQQSSALDIPTQLRVTYHHRTLRDYFLSQPRRLRTPLARPQTPKRPPTMGKRLSLDPQNLTTPYSQRRRTTNDYLGPFIPRPPSRTFNLHRAEKIPPHIHRCRTQHRHLPPLALKHWLRSPLFLRRTHNLATNQSRSRRLPQFTNICGH